MYDATTEANEFIADSKDEAIANATRFFSVEADELRVIEPSVGQIFGQGSRAIIVAVPKSAPRRKPSGGDRDRGDRGDRDRGRERGGRESRDRDRGGDRGGRERGRGRGRERSDRHEAHEAKAEERPTPKPSTGEAKGDLSEVGAYVLGVVERMALGSFEVSETEEDDFVVVELQGPAAEQLSADDSRVVGALQLLANQAAMRGDEPKRIVLDCAGDLGEREAFLERTAGRAARRAVDTGRSVALDPMNGRDRRALHVAVREIDGVTTMSVGTGSYRQVVIVPEAAPEYKEALAAATAAADRDSN